MDTADCEPLLQCSSCVNSAFYPPWDSKVSLSFWLE